jgi:hypothetical protein
MVDQRILAYINQAHGDDRWIDGKRTQEVGNLVDALRPVERLFSDSPAGEFRPLKLRAVREQMLPDGLSRSTINDRVNRIRRYFRWGVSVQAIPGPIIYELQPVESLGLGRSKAEECDPVRPAGIGSP